MEIRREMVRIWTLHITRGTRRKVKKIWPMEETVHKDRKTREMLL
jgi:hypothetical protein